MRARRISNLIAVIVTLGVSLCFAALALVLGTSTAFSQSLPVTTGDSAPAATPGIRSVDDETRALIDSLEIPPVTPGTPLSLGAALSEVRERNPGLEAARTSIEESEARLSMAWGALLPFVSGSLQYSHADHADEMDMGASMAPILEAMGMPADAAGEPTVMNPTDKVSGSITASVTLVDVQAWYSVGLAESGVALTELTVENVERSLLGATARAYYLAGLSQSFVEMQQGQVESAARQVVVVTRKVEAGSAPEIDQIRAETDLVRALEDLNDARRSLDASRDALGVLLGRDALITPTSLPSLSPPAVAGGEMEDAAMGQRPDVKLARAQVEFADEQLDTTWMQFIPTLGAAWQGTYQFTEPSGLGSSDPSRWTAMLTLNVPIYNHIRYAELDEKRAAVQRSRFEQEDMERNARLEVRNARRDHLSALEAVTTAEQQLALSTRAMQITMLAYSEGAGSSYEVSDARRTLSTAQINVVSARLQHALSVLDLYLALGEDIASLAQYAPSDDAPQASTLDGFGASLVAEAGWGTNSDLP